MRPSKFSLLLTALLMAGQGFEAGQAPGQPASAGSKGSPKDHVLHPWALAELVEELGGHAVTLLKARVLTVLNPRVFLIETASRLSPVRDNLDRVLVFVDDGALRIEPELIVDSNVRVIGVARTLVGMQMTREVPWPPELTREVLKRYEIRAAVLATSVQTAEGVELTDRVR
jgi:hypothetical protein